MNALFSRLGAIALALVVTACATKYPPAPTEAQTSDYSYRIGPLDSLNVIVWRNPEVERWHSFRRQAHPD